jgi:hypothetical protein
MTIPASPCLPMLGFGCASSQPTLLPRLSLMTWMPAFIGFRRSGVGWGVNPNIVILIGMAMLGLAPNLRD